MSISLRRVKHPLSSIPGVWRRSYGSYGAWLLATHLGPVAVQYGDWILKIGRKTWVVEWPLQ